MVRSAVLRSVRPILVAMTLATASCGDGDRLPELETLPREHTQQDDAPQEPAPEDGEPSAPLPEDAAASEEAEIGLRLSLPGEAGIDTVTYTLERDGETLAEAVIPIMDEQAVGVQLGNLPSGDGYTLHLVVEREGLPPCEGRAMLVIEQGRTTDVSLTLVCPGVPAPSPH